MVKKWLSVALALVLAVVTFAAIAAVTQPAQPTQAGVANAGLTVVFDGKTAYTGGVTSTNKWIASSEWLETFPSADMTQTVPITYGIQSSADCINYLPWLTVPVSKTQVQVPTRQNAVGACVRTVVDVTGLIGGYTPTLRLYVK